MMGLDVVSDIIGGIAGYDANQKQMGNAKEAQEANLEYLQNLDATTRQTAGTAADMISGGAAAGRSNLVGMFDEGRRSLLDQYGRGMDTLAQAGGRAMGDLRGGYNQAGDAMTGAYNTATGQMQGYGDRGLAALGSGYGAAQQQMGQVAGLQQFIDPASRGYQAANVLGSQDRLGNMLDQPGGMYGGFQQDPGYAFRQQQGEQALNRSAAAQGGRLGGAQLKALANYNQNLASQEFGNFANRQQAQAGVMGSSDAQRAALMQNQAGRMDAAAGQRQNALMQLAQAGIGGQQGLAGLSAARGGAESGYMQNLGSGLAGLTSQYGANMGNLWQGGARDVSNLEMGIGSGLSGAQFTLGNMDMQNFRGLGQDLNNNIYGSAVAQGNALTGGSQAAGGLAGSFIAANNQYTPYSGGGSASIANTANSVAASNNALGNAVIGGVAKGMGGGM